VYAEEREKKKECLSVFFRCRLSIDVKRKTTDKEEEEEEEEKNLFFHLSLSKLLFSSCFYHRANDRHHHHQSSSSKLTSCYVHSHKHSSEMAKPERETVLGQEEVWVHGTGERTDAAGTRKENLERPRRHVFEKVSVG
jgi:hypothetical protein